MDEGPDAGQRDDASGTRGAGVGARIRRHAESGSRGPRDEQAGSAEGKKTGHATRASQKNLQKNDIDRSGIIVMRRRETASNSPAVVNRDLRPSPSIAVEVKEHQRWVGVGVGDQPVKISHRRIFHWKASKGWPRAVKREFGERSRAVAVRLAIPGRGARAFRGR